MTRFCTGILLLFGLLTGLCLPATAHAQEPVNATVVRVEKGKLIVTEGADKEQKEYLLKQAQLLDEIGRRVLGAQILEVFRNGTEVRITFREKMPRTIQAVKKKG